MMKEKVIILSGMPESVTNSRSDCNVIAPDRQDMIRKLLIIAKHPNQTN